MPQPRSSSPPGDDSRQSERKSSGPGITGFAEQFANRIVNPLDLIILTRERLEETLGDAAERGRITRDDANELIAELVRRGRQQTEDTLADIEQLLGRGRDQIESATRRARHAEPVERIVRTADRAADKALRTVGAGPPPTLPILGYDDLTARHVLDRLGGLTPAQLRAVREYERRHANRKSVLGAIEKALR